MKDAIYGFKLFVNPRFVALEKAVTKVIIKLEDIIKTLINLIIDVN